MSDDLWVTLEGSGWMSTFNEGKTQNALMDIDSKVMFFCLQSRRSHGCVSDPQTKIWCVNSDALIGCPSHPTSFFHHIRQKCHKNCARQTSAGSSSKKAFCLECCTSIREKFHSSLMQVSLYLPKANNALFSENPSKEAIHLHPLIPPHSLNNPCHIHPNPCKKDAVETKAPAPRSVVPWVPWAPPSPCHASPPQKMAKTATFFGQKRVCFSEHPQSYLTY